MTFLDQQDIERLLFEEKQRLSELPYFERDALDQSQGVLLSDRIAHYCKPEFKLISPLRELNLRPAGYDLRVGNNYAQKGEHYTLNEGGFLTIGACQRV